MKWFYDCESPNASAIVATLSPPDEAVEPINQNLDRLQNDLFDQYDASVAPNGLDSFTIEITRSHFIQTKSLMTSYGRYRAVYTNIVIHIHARDSERGGRFRFIFRCTFEISEKYSIFRGCLDQREST